MRSPFPGMDPYLEGEWSDVHLSLCAYISEALQPRLPTDLRARIARDPRSDDELDDRGVRPTPNATDVAPAFQERCSHRWVQIIDVGSRRRVVTAIEILSPGNKRPVMLNDAYVRKLNDSIAAGVNVVELDLLRGRRHRLPIQHEDLPPARAGEYPYSVRRANHDGSWHVYPMRLRERLPVLPVPLRTTDADVALDLQPIVDRAYVAGGHDDIDYARPLDPPLSGEDAAWVAQRLTQRAAG